ncbi:WhiB family transcriptional regulator [Isoptericola sp. QY 916]|nr:WhiB family transcriptional regulator [Isoptericola sp. QY 916]
MTPQELAQAACLAEDPELFFAPEGRRDSAAEQDRVAQAKAVCASCDVRARCLEVALSNGESDGIFGGLTEDERRSLRRRRSRQAALARSSARPAPTQPAPSPQEEPVPTAEKPRTRRQRPTLERADRVRQVAALYTGDEQLTQVQIATRLGISPATVAKMLREADVAIRPSHTRPKRWAPPASAEKDSEGSRPGAEPAPAPRPSVRPASSGHGFVWTCPGHKPVVAELTRTYKAAWLDLEDHLRKEHPREQEAADQACHADALLEFANGAGS